MSLHTDPLATEHGTLKSYTIGFLVSIALTLITYFLVVKEMLPAKSLIVTIIALGGVQFVIQMIFFLHLAKENKPRIKLIAFLFMLMVLVIICGGTIWIMQSLDERTMPPMDMEMHMMEHEGIHK